MSVLLEARDVTVSFTVRDPGRMRTRQLRAVDGVTLAIAEREHVGVVGESGCGKSTLARALLRLAPLAGGELRWRGERYDALSAEAMRPIRRGLQVVFQDPVGSLDPRMAVAECIGEGLDALGQPASPDDRRARILQALVSVGLDPGLAERYPHELSGGQCQRVAIARAMIVGPKLLICDEATSALDVSVQAQIVNLLADLQASAGLAVLFISHNLAVVRQLCESVLVMYFGRVVEQAPSDALYDAPFHPYTRALIAAVPTIEARNASRSQSQSPAAQGEAPSALAPPRGCAFHTRCPHAVQRCLEQVPALEAAGDRRWVACHRWRELG